MKKINGLMLAVLAIGACNMVSAKEDAGESRFEKARIILDYCVDGIVTNIASLAGENWNSKYAVNLRGSVRHILENAHGNEHNRLHFALLLLLAQGYKKDQPDNTYNLFLTKFLKSDRSLLERVKKDFNGKRLQ